MKIQKVKRYTALFGATMLLAGIAVQAFPSKSAEAAQITNRSLTLQAGTFDSDGDLIPDGGSLPGGKVLHNFAFTLPSGDNTAATAIGSIKFQYCTTAAAVPLGINCNAPAGIDATGAQLGNQTGVTGFTTTAIVNQDDATDGIMNTVIIEKAAAANVASPNTAVTYRIDNIKNPTSAMTFFVRISTYSSIDGSGTPIDTGTVAAATSLPIKISGTMPESLVFCAGKTVTETNSVPDCSTATTGNIAFDRLFSPTDTALATSQMAASTNAGQGYAITVNGPTLTSGTNTIAEMDSATPADHTSQHGKPQFGMNVVLNDGTNNDPAVTFGNPGPDMTTMPTGYAPSANVVPTTDNINYNATAATGYNTNGVFSFSNNATVATSNNIGSNAQIYTASCIVNVPGNQPAGTYASTLTYICTATF